MPALSPLKSVICVIEDLFCYGKDQICTEVEAWTHDNFVWPDQPLPVAARFFAPVGAVLLTRGRYRPDRSPVPFLTVWACTGPVPDPR